MIREAASQVSGQIPSIGQQRRICFLAAWLCLGLANINALLTAYANSLFKKTPQFTGHDKTR